MAGERRSTGTLRGFGQAATAYNSRRREERKKEDVTAIDQGETVWLMGLYRGLYGNYPKSFKVCRLYLAPDGPVIRPQGLFSRKPILVTEDFISARVRQFSGPWEAFQVRGGGQYGPGGSLEQSGKVIISCVTSGGVLEFSVPRPDVELSLYYFGRLYGA